MFEGYTEITDFLKEKYSMPTLLIRPVYAGNCAG